jgi:hypothetical protein
MIAGCNSLEDKTVFSVLSAFPLTPLNETGTLPRDPALQVAALDTACTVEEMDVPGLRLHF